MRDGYGRTINYLRVSVTDRCNLRCRYCMPEDGVELKKHSEILSLEEIFSLVKCSTVLGIRRVRLTGGEPLVRKNLPELVKRLADLSRIEEVSLTTNATLLERFALDLKKAGLARVNISLDTLQEEKFSYITRGGRLAEVWYGIEAALKAGLNPVKLNVVVVKGFNDDEVLDFAHLTREMPLHIRFIELMPIGESRNINKEYIPVGLIKEKIAERFAIGPASGISGNGPAKYYTLENALGTIGFIGAMSDHFCHTCNRVRLTADGKLRTCLQNGEETDLLTPLRQGASQQQLVTRMAEAIASKPREHNMFSDNWNQWRIMSQIGG